MAASSGPTLFNQAISRIFSCWNDLQAAIAFGFGTKQMEQHLAEDVEQLFRRNARTDYYDVHDFLEDELDEKFNVCMEGDSHTLQMISQHICECHIHLQEGRVGEVEKFLQGLPTPSGQTPVNFHANCDDDSSEEGEDDDQDMAGPSHNGDSNTTAAQPSTSSKPDGAGDADMDVDPEENDGWTTVKKGRGKKS